MDIEKIPVPGEIKKEIKKKDKTEKLLAEVRVWEKEKKEQEKGEHKIETTDKEQLRKLGIPDNLQGQAEGALKDHREIPKQKKGGTKEKLSVKNQVLDLVGNTEIILNSKELEPKDKAELVEDYSKQLASLLNKPTNNIYLTELIKDNKKLEQLLNNIPRLKEQRKEKNRVETTINKKVSEAKKEEEKHKTKAISQAKEFIKSQEKKKESIWGKAGAGVGLFFSLSFVLLILLYLKGIEKLTGTNIKTKK